MSDDDIAAMSYESALAELEEIISRLEAGAVALDDAIAAYERGTKLAQRCSELLDRTEQRVTQLVVDAGGGLSERRVEPGAPAGDRPRPPEPTSRARPAGDASDPPALFPGLGEPPVRSPRGASLPIDPDDIPF